MQKIRKTFQKYQKTKKFSKNFQQKKTFQFHVELAGNCVCVSVFFPQVVFISNLVDVNEQID